MMERSQNKVLVLLSGGLDSSVCVALALARNCPVSALCFDYGQKNRREIKCAQDLSFLWGFPIRVLPVEVQGNDPTKEIPARNSIFLTTALGHALVQGAGEVCYGAEPDARYVDSSVKYIEAMQAVFRLHGVELSSPVKGLSGKREVLETALDLGVPLDCVHSSLTAAMDGKDMTSGRYFKALQTFFPRMQPEELLQEVAVSRPKERLRDIASAGDAYIDLSAPQCGSFKYLPALFLLASIPCYLPETVTVYTTGNWGRALQVANEKVGAVRALHIEETNDPAVLARNRFNTNQRQAVWGTKQVLALLPRPALLRKWLQVAGENRGPVVLCRVTQGHLLDTLRQMGFEAANANNIPEDCIGRPKVWLQTEMV